MIVLTRNKELKICLSSVAGPENKQTAIFKCPKGQANKRTEAKTYPQDSSQSNTFFLGPLLPLSISFFKAQPEGALNILPLYWHFKPNLVSLSSLPFSCYLCCRCLHCCSHRSGCLPFGDFGCPHGLLSCCSSCSCLRC